MCIFIDHDVQLVIDLCAIQVRTRLLLMTMIASVLLITNNVYITIPLSIVTIPTNSGS